MQKTGRDKDAPKAWKCPRCGGKMIVLPPLWRELVGRPRWHCKECGFDTFDEPPVAGK